MHTCVAFLLPGIPIRLNALRPELLANQRDRLGALLLQRRRELALDRRAAARLIGVDAKTLMWWERDEKLPFVGAYPAIIRFLGYEPGPRPVTLAEALIAERRRRGLRIEQAAGEIGVDPGTWRRWEHREWRPTRRTLGALNHWLGYDARTAFPREVR